MHVRKLAFVLHRAGRGGASASATRSANNWPPAKGADMTDPNNWPNDPGYQSATWGTTGRGCPSRRAPRGLYLSTPTSSLGASGMHIDVGWTYTTGRPDVKIAIIELRASSGTRRTSSTRRSQTPASSRSTSRRPPAAARLRGATGALAGYDCNGDGVFSVADAYTRPTRASRRW